MHSTQKEAIKVCVRLRPLLKPYEDEEVWTIDNQTILTTANLNESASLKESRIRCSEHLAPQSFTFDCVYGPECSSETIYEEVCTPIVSGVLQGYNGSIFLYGQTTSGKTYTMLGVPESPGVLPCSMQSIFRAISQDSTRDFSVWVSYLEIYNEQINDLLVPGSVNLKIKEDPKLGSVVSGIKQQQVWTFDQVILLMNYGEEQRVYKETSIHEHSSRSHTIFQVTVESSEDSQEARVKHSSLNLVDLAGSERISEFEERNSNKTEETGHINKSLFVLAHVVNTLSEGKKHIPYRDSKLTRILRNALGGNALAGIICTVSPAAMNYQQSLSTLRFATRAKKVHNSPKVNEIINESLSINEYKLEINKLRTELSRIQTEKDYLETSNQSLKKQNSNLKNEVKLRQDQLSKIKIESSTEKEILSKLEDALEKQQTEYNTSKTHLEQKNQNLLEKLQYERTQRSKLVKELEKYKSLYTKAVKSEEGSLKHLNEILTSAGEKPIEIPVMQSTSQVPSEAHFIENVLFHLAEETVEDRGYWNNQTQNIKDSYEAELAELQNKHLNFLSDLAKQVFPKNSKVFRTLEGFRVTSVEKNAELSSVEFQFSEILEEFMKDPKASVEFGEMILSKLKDHKEELVLHIEEKYHNARKRIESYFSQELNSSLRSAYEISELYQENTYLMKKLQSQYEALMQDLEDKYMQSLKLYEEFVYSSPKEYEAYMWGSGKDGRCGLGSEDTLCVPEILPNLQLANLVCGYHHSAGISQSGVLYTWGRGIFGQLGHGVSESVFMPTPVKGLSDIRVTQVACGWQHTLALSDLGMVYSWGNGDEGQLGHSGTKDFTSPKLIQGLSEVTYVSAGHSHSGCISNRVLFMWGANSDSRLFVKAPESLLSPTKVQLPKAPKQLSLGLNHSGVVTEGGYVFAAGSGEDGQLGSSHRKAQIVEVEPFSSENRAEMVSCGDCFTLVLTNEGRVWSFGKGSNGRTGLGFEHAVENPQVIRSLENVVWVDAGCRHSGAVDCYGNVFMWGFNFYEQLGVGEGDSDSFSPVRLGLEGCTRVSCGYFHSGALVRN